jgi:hypothetical protein
VPTEHIVLFRFCEPSRSHGYETLSRVLEAREDIEVSTEPGNVSIGFEGTNFTRESSLRLRAQRADYVDAAPIARYEAALTGILAAIGLTLPRPAGGSVPGLRQCGCWRWDGTRQIRLPRASLEQTGTS